MNLEKNKDTIFFDIDDHHFENLNATELQENMKRLRLLLPVLA